MDSLPQQVSIIAIASIFSLVVGIGIILLVVVYQKRQLTNAREKEQLRAGFNQQILESKLEIQEQTFKNISQEIHDNIGQVLSLAKLTMNRINYEEPEKVILQVDTAKQLVSKAIEDLRNLSRNLNTDYITNLGLSISIENEIRLIKSVSSLHADIQVDGEPYRLSNQQELIIFRIFQELLQNIIKHAGASALKIHFAYKHDLFKLVISDNGIGFEEKKEGELKGIGLNNIFYRAKLIGADVSIETIRGEGTTVAIQLPINDEKHER